MRLVESRRLYHHIIAFLKSKTRQFIENQGYVVDGVVAPCGAGKSTLYKVVNLQLWHVEVAKVYSQEDVGDEDALRETKRSIAAEILAVKNGELHQPQLHPHLVAYHIIEFSHITLPTKSIAFVLPFYPITLEEVLDAYHDNPLPAKLVRQLKDQMLSALERIFTCGYSHSDLKPGNIMLKNSAVEGEAHFVLIDCGSVVQLGLKAAENTRGYGLGSNLYSLTRHYDLCCLLVTLGRCFLHGFRVEFAKCTSVTSFKGELEKSDLTEHVAICEDVLKLLEAIV